MQPPLSTDQREHRHPFFKVPPGGRQKLLKMIYSVKGCAQRPARPGERARRRQEQRCVLQAGAALLRVIGRFDISEVVIGVATFERGLGNCRLIYDCRAPR